jgi:8-oxo-dGTP pyrophosphatase MutT (NUDIX family)
MFDGNTVHYTLDSQGWIIRIEFDRNVYLYKDHLSNPLEVNPVYYYYGYSPSKKSIVFADGETRAVYAYNVTNGIDMKLTKDMIPEYLDDSEYYKRHASIGLREDVSIKPFEPKDELNPKFWVNNKLNSKVRMRLLDIADDFVKTLDIRWVKPEDIVLTGSIANYNWTKFSDVDIHIIMDFKKVYKKTDFVKSYFDSKKQEWNGIHEGLKIYGFNVELSVEDTDAPAVASGVYSLEKNEWVSEPKDLSDAKLNKEYVEETAESYIEKIDDLERRIKKEKDAKKVETLSNKMVSIFNKLKGMRREGLKTKAKEMSSGNIIWKILRAEGYIKKIWDVVNYNYDKQMSLNEAVTGKDNKKGSALYVYALDKKNGEWHVLCARRKNRRDDEEGGKWNPPMGHVHRGEDMLDGAIRECFEESGIDFDDYKGKIKLMDTHKWGNNYRLILKNDYTKDFKPGDGDEENDDFIWLPVSEISSKKWAYTCGENAVKYSPKTVYVTEEQISRMREDDTADGGSITLYHGVSCEDLEFNLENGGFVPRVCSDGGPKAIWLSEKQYEYSFTFKFTFPTELLGKKLIQQTTVDYTYDDFIGFNDFGCELVKTLIYQHERGFSVEIDLKDIDMCKEQVRFMPEEYRKFDERMKKYPLVYKTFVKPVMDEIGVTETHEQVNEDVSNRRVIFLTEEQYNKIVPGKNELYLNSWLNRFRERTRIPDLETSQLHDIMAKLKLYQVPGKIGVYKRDDVEYLLNNPDKVRGMLGKEPLFSNDNRKQKTERIPVETKPKYVGPDENDDKDDGIPPLSKMKKASFELLKKDGVFGYSKK